MTLHCRLVGNGAAKEPEGTHRKRLCDHTHTHARAQSCRLLQFQLETIIRTSSLRFRNNQNINHLGEFRDNVFMRKSEINKGWKMTYQVMRSWCTLKKKEKKRKSRYVKIKQHIFDIR